MYSIWKRLFIVVIILLVSSSAFGGYFWYQLNVTKNQLADTKVQLDNTLVELDATKVQLDNTLVELDTTKAQLTDTKTLLDTTQTQLVDTEAELGTIKAQLVDTETQLNVTKTQLDTTTIQLETEKANNSRMLSQYVGLKQEIDSKMGRTQEDMQSFITPNDSSVSARVMEITGGYSGDVNDYWKDAKRLYSWVVSNISYSYDSYMPILPETISGELIWGQECWRMPEETLEDETGDCEDMAVLLASMLLSYNEGDYAIWAIEIRSEDAGHVAVAFPVQGGKLTILDPAGNYYTGQYGALDSSNISYAVNKWLSHWQRQMPNAEIVRVFSGNFYEEFSSTAEFITWAQE